MRLATCLLTVAVLAVAGCGDSSDETTSAPAGGASVVEKSVKTAWELNPDCKRPPGASRWGCSVGSYRCQGVVTGRGLSIDCAKPGRSIAFTVPRG